MDTPQAYYPDFAILAQSSRAYRYRKLYFVNFTTNEGQTDDLDERVIYSAQNTTRGTSLKARAYCQSRGLGDYKSCMFSQLDLCYGDDPIRAPAKRRIRNWLDLFPILQFSVTVSNCQ